MGKTVNVTKYPEGLEILAKELDLPIPEDDIEARKEYVKAAIGYFVTL